VRWTRGAGGDDVIDQRGRSGRGVAVGGGTGIVGIIITLIVILSGGGGDGSGGFGIPGLPGALGDQQVPAAGPGDAIPASQDPDRDLKDFSAYVFTDAQRFWASTFGRGGQDYGKAKLVLYRDAVQSGCGGATSAVGPFYCPADRRVYLDLGFYRQMTSELRAPGDFAWAYVIAHEMGHHVQQELGTDDEVRRAAQDDPGQANALSVRQELQADCYAGVWARGVFRAGDLEEGDIEEAFTAAEAVGDDRLQREATGTVRPDTFTHGTSAQRRRWFDTGYASGRPERCDTFAADTL
jgi:predicted metalloprotease